MKSVFRQSIITLFITAAVNYGSIVQAADLPIPINLAVEAEEAQKKQIPIVVLFMEESCSYCKTASEDFLQPMLLDPEYRNKVILRQIETESNEPFIDFDGGETTYRSFSRKYKVSVVPNVMLFDSSGRVLTYIEGLMTVDYYYGFLCEAIDDSIEKIKATSH